MPVWIDNEEEQLINDRDKLIYLLKHISPKAGLCPQETYSYPGVVGATREIFKIIDKVNLAKDDFKKFVLKYKKSSGSSPHVLCLYLLQYNYMFLRIDAL